MSRVMDEKIAELLVCAAEDGRCYVPRGEDAGRVRRALSRRVANGTVVSPVRGLFVDAQMWERAKPAQRALCVAHGLQEAHPNWVFCGPTAALAYGIDVSETLLEQVHIATTSRRLGSGSAHVARHAVLSEPPRSDQIEVAGRLRVTLPDQTVLDCLRWSDFAHGLGVIDSALRLGVVGRDSFEGYVDEVSERFRGIDRALSTLSWADPRSENGGESIARARMLLLGYARPELQVEVPRVVEQGRPYRADFCWVRADGAVILGELDGKVKYVERELMGGRDIDEVISDENIRGSRTLWQAEPTPCAPGRAASPGSPRRRAPRSRARRGWSCR